MLSIMLVVLSVAGCTGSMNVSPTATPTAAPTVAPTVTAAPTPAITATPVPTVAPTATIIVTPKASSNASDYVWPAWIDYHYQTPSDSKVVLVVNGKVHTALQLTMKDLKAFTQYTVTASKTNSKGSTLTVSGTGPHLNDLLNKAGVEGDATTVTMISTVVPTYSKDVPLSSVMADPDATVFILGDGSLRNVFPAVNPGTGTGSWVANLTTITVS